MAEAVLLKSGGGGATSDELTATRAQVLEGKTAVTSDSNDEPITGTMLSDATISTNGQMLNGIVAYGRNGTKYTGSIPLKAAATYTPTTSNQTITAGQYLNGAQTIAGSSGLVPGNIRSGSSIFNVQGQFTGNATAAAGDILTGKTAGIKGSMVTGTLGTMAGGTYTPTKSAQTVSCSGKKMTGNIVINAIPSQYVDVKTNQTVFNNGVCSIVTRIYPKILYYWRNGWTINVGLDGLAEGASYIQVPTTRSGETYPTQYSFFDGSVQIGNFNKVQITYTWTYSGTQKRYGADAVLSIYGIKKNPVLESNNNLFNAIHSGTGHEISIGENQPVIGQRYSKTETKTITFSPDGSGAYLRRNEQYFIAFREFCSYYDNTMMLPTDVKVTKFTLMP